MPDIQTMAHAIRFLALDSILNADEGHQGVPFGMAEICRHALCQEPEGRCRCRSRASAPQLTPRRPR